jgi:hypothetical protein
LSLVSSSIRERCIYSARDSALLFSSNYIFYWWAVTRTLSTTKLQVHPLSHIPFCLFNTFADASCMIWRPSFTSATRGRSTAWLQGIPLARLFQIINSNKSENMCNT